MLLMSNCGESSACSLQNDECDGVDIGVGMKVEALEEVIRLDRLKDESTAASLCSSKEDLRVNS